MFRAVGSFGVRERSEIRQTKTTADPYGMTTKEQARTKQRTSNGDKKRTGNDNGKRRSPSGMTTREATATATAKATATAFVLVGAVLVLRRSCIVIESRFVFVRVE